LNQAKTTQGIKWGAYWRLIRADKPIGIYLLLWPCVWALWIASSGIPNLHILIVFVLGVIIMRSAGCVINDFADRKLDGAVKRTSERPLVTGELSAKQAIILFVTLLLMAFLLVLTLSWPTVFMSLGGLVLATIYPFMKRYTHLPQVVLGAAFGWSIPMAFVAIGELLNWVVWALYFANLSWTVAYDTQYAMVDRDDDIKIGVKSTAILFAQFDKVIIGILQALALFLLIAVGQHLQLSWIFNFAVFVSFLLFLYQQWLIKDRQRDLCFKAFLHNHYVGLVIAMGVIGHYSFY
jgi:4-hydroxybenzoate polyprenyltransferase